jgi:ferredoxin
MDLVSAAERLAAIDRSEVAFDQKGCLHSRDKFSECTACFEVCPLDAIQPGKPPGFDYGSCDNCLACLPVCPAGAFSADDALPSLLNCAARAESRSIELVCELHPQPDMGLPGSMLGVQVRACLVGLGPGAYLGLAALGFERIIARTDHCEDCPLGALAPKIDAHPPNGKNNVRALGMAGTDREDRSWRQLPTQACLGCRKPAHFKARPVQFCLTPGSGCRRSSPRKGRGVFRQKAPQRAAPGHQRHCPPA